MKRISLFLLLFLLLKATVMYSQDGHPETNFRIVPVSPNAASLGTFGMIPTDNYVGQANLTIPIYEIDLDGKKFPIALSYHTDGTRVAQEATWIGLGSNPPGRRVRRQTSAGYGRLCSTWVL